MTTICAALNEARARLTDCDSPTLDAEVLLAHVLHRPRSYVHAWPTRSLEGDGLSCYRRLVEARVGGVPVAYLTGSREFWSLRLKVTRDTLIPRPESELLVEQALGRIDASATRRVLDLGTGSGAIALALAVKRPRLRITASDISRAALEVARDNAEALGASLELIESDWFSTITGRYELIVCNPPYVASNDPCLGSGDLRHEPAIALNGGADGLDAIRRVSGDARGHLTHGAWLLLEHGFDQSVAVRTILDQHGYTQIVTCCDLAGHERVSGGRHP